MQPVTFRAQHLASERHVTSASHLARLERYAAKVSADPENTKWVAEVRELVKQGVPEEQLVGHDAPARMKQAAKRRPSRT